MATCCTTRSIPASEEELPVSTKTKEDTKDNSTCHHRQSFDMAMRCTMKMRSITMSQEELPVSTKAKEDIKDNSTCHHKQSFDMAT
eukprot:6344242-Ditylum_brightwellii.AAC.1